MTKFKVKTVIICDDARREASGKEILIGVYNDTIVFPTFPAVMERLYVRIAVSCDPDFSGDFTFSVQGPDDREIFSATQPANKSDSGDSDRLFGFALRGFPFLTEGTYSILFGLGGKPRSIWTVTARVAANASEMERIGNSS